MQYFLHKYRDKHYKFLIVDVLQKCFTRQLREFLDNLVLDLVVYNYISRQRIYLIISISRELIYLLNALDKLN